MPLGNKQCRKYRQV